MARLSDPLLALLRKLLDERKMNTASLAAVTQLPRARVRRVLGGQDPMTVEELLVIGQALDLKPSDLGVAGLEDPSESTPAEALTEVAEGDEIDDDEVSVNPWGNHPKQLFRVAFSLGCDFFFSVDAKALADSGVPKHVYQAYEGRELPIRLDAAYHQYNEPRYTESGIMLTLSFDALYECTFPWKAIRQFVLFPVAPEDPPTAELDELSEEVPAPRPHLRLVT